MLKPISQTGVTDGPVEPSSPSHDRRHDGPQHVAGDAAILRQRGFEVQPVFWPVSRRARSAEVSHDRQPLRPTPDGYVGGSATVADFILASLRLSAKLSANLCWRNAAGAWSPATPHNAVTELFCPPPVNVKVP